MKENKNTQRIKKLTALAVLAALAYVLHFIHIPVMFLNLDFKDVVTAIAGMYFGPISGLCLRRNNGTCQRGICYGCRYDDGKSIHHTLLYGHAEK